MTIQELERQLLTLDRNERIRLIQVMAQSLAIPSQDVSVGEASALAEVSTTWNHTPNLDNTSIVDFFRNSPLAEAINSGELDLSRDLKWPPKTGQVVKL
jgi:hypothetical protein